MGPGRQVVLFDGVCNLCNGAVQFIIRHDPHGTFQFAPLQSDFGRSQLKKMNLPSGEFDSILLMSGDKVYDKSDAALRIARELTGGWKFFYGLIHLPRFIRDGGYNLIAKNRYRLFGRQDNCMIPTAELKARFIQ